METGADDETGLEASRKEGPEAPRTLGGGEGDCRHGERGEFFRLVEVETSAALVSVDLPRALAEEAQALL